MSADPEALGHPLADRTFASVLLDLDGTLVDSTPAVTRSWVTWALEHDIDPLRLQGFHGVPAAAIVRELMPGADVTAAARRIDELELADLTGVVPLPGAPELVAGLPPERAAIVTSCRRPLARARLRAAGLSEPEVMVTFDDVTRGKPDPEPYLLGARLLGVDPADCLVVEDAPLGIASARAAGCAVLAVVTTTPRDELGGADLVVGSLDEVAVDALPDGVRVRLR